jgi:uncharacterized protein YgbK (DUF1537 family)
MILADDLTGACDTAVKFASGGGSVRLVLADLRSAAADIGPDVLAYSTESRALASVEAYRRTRDAAQATGCRPIYKKVDSTLRGNVGAEIDALLDTLPDEAALLCPTLPAQGRSVVGAHLLVDGIPVSQTPIAHDLLAPVHHSHIPTLLAEQTERKIGTVDASCVAAGPDAVAAQLRALVEDEVTIVVADAQSDPDLSCLVQACNDAERPFVLCGSAGLAAPLASGRSPSTEPPAPVERVVAVVGSLHHVAQTQARTLSRRARWPLLSLSTQAALDGGNEWDEWCESMRAALAQFATQASGVVLVADRDVLTAWPSGAHRRLAGREIADLISERIAEVAETTVELMEAGGRLVTGGDTSAAALRRLGADGVELAGELEPGVPFGCVTGGPRAGLFIATKAGGFGEADLLWRAACKLTDGR